MAKASADGQASFDCIDRSGPTKYQVMDTGNFSRDSPARPAATKFDIENSVFYGLSTLLYSDYLLTACTWKKQKLSSSKRKAMKLPSSSVEDIMSPPVSALSAFINSIDSMKAGRKPEVPYHESFVGTSMKLLLLIKALQ